MKTLLLIILLSFITIHSSVIVIPIEKEIGPGLYTFLKRAVKDAEKEKPDIIVFEINTFGGRVDAALDIVELISAIETRTVAYVKEKAISAGALISLACNDLVMGENTTIGDVAPVMMGKQGSKMMGEKFQSPLRAKFRSLASKNNYPVKLSEAMVSIDKEVILITFKGGKKSILTGVEYNDLTENEKKKIIKKKTIVPKGELLTMSAKEAENLGFSRKTVKDFSELLTYLGKSEKDIKYIIKKRSEKLLILMNKIAPILILIGLAGIYMEVKTPGFGLFGIIGITAFLLFFSTKYVVGLADHVEFVIFISGIMLLFIEIFVIPGFGVIGASGIGLILVSVLLSMQSFVIPKMPWDFLLFKQNILQVGILFLLSIPLFFITLFSASKIVLTSKIGHTESEQTTDGFSPAKDYSNLIGKKGFVLSELRPAGTVEIDGNRLDVVSDGEYINEGVQTIVAETVGNRIVVKRT